MKAEILVGDVIDRLRQLPSDSVHCVVTSPPYWGLRDYGVEGQIGLVALANRCDYIGIELNPDYAAMAQRRIDALLAQEVMVFA